MTRLEICYQVDFWQIEKIGAFTIYAPSHVVTISSIREHGTTGATWPRSPFYPVFELGPVALNSERRSNSRVEFDSCRLDTALHQ
jgi:hypothetical protein